MKRCLKTKKIKTTEEIKQDIWDNLSFDTISKLIDSIPKRIQHVVDKQGETIFLIEFH